MQEAIELAEIAESPSPAQERAQGKLEHLRRLLPFDAAWLALADPTSTTFTSLASVDLDEGTLRYLSGPTMVHDSEATHSDPGFPPLSPSDLPYPATELRTWSGASSLPASTRRWEWLSSTNGSAISATSRCCLGARSPRPRSCGVACTTSPAWWRAGSTRCAPWSWQRA